MPGTATLEVPDAVFRLVGGDPALDFVNTASWFAAPTRDWLDLVGKERLVVPGDVVRWGVTAGILSASERAGAPRDLLRRARTLRRAMRRIFKGAIEGWPAAGEDLAAFDRELGAARRAERLVPHGPHFRWEWRDPPAAEDQVLWTVARRAADLLTSGLLEKVGECRGEECGWLFLDISRNHSRRWCEMADCGNLAKVRRFRGRGPDGARP